MCYRLCYAVIVLMCCESCRRVCLDVLHVNAVSQWEMV